MSAVQAMLLQAEGDQIWLLPAWPRTWNVAFKLHAPRQTTVQGIYRDGQLEHLTVTPPDRRQDIRPMLDEPAF
jgi:alpha-L-fucosidase 2